jgi:hypothetical protein
VAQRGYLRRFIATSIVVLAATFATVVEPALARAAEPTTSVSPERVVRRAAIAWAKAFFTGTPRQIARMQGSECRPRSAERLDRATVASYLRGLRAVMRRRLGRPLDAIGVRAARVRNVTATTGEAEVQYDLPRSVVGNDNWVEFRLENGRWKVSNCHAPIGGESSSSTASSP